MTDKRIKRPVERLVKPLPCPFCGAKGYRNSHGGYWIFECKESCYHFERQSNGWLITDSDVARWNKRFNTKMNGASQESEHHE